PATPRNVRAAAGDTQVVVRWDASARAESYSVYRATSPGGEGATPYQTGLTSTTWTDTGLTNGTTYYYRVTAVNGSGESEMSDEVSARPAAAGTAIDAGGKAVGSFQADTGFSGGLKAATRARIDTSRVSNPAPLSVYQTLRYGNNFIYTIGNLTP